MTRPLPFWPLDWWAAWWDALTPEPYVAPLADAAQAPCAGPAARHRLRPALGGPRVRAHAVRALDAGPCPVGGTGVQGFVMSRRAADEAEILSVVLSPALRGGGHSRGLLREHLSSLAHAGISRVLLEVDEGNVPALKLYARHGFRKVGERTGYYLKADGSRATALTMSADL